jgi:hypothetical protein
MWKEYAIEPACVVQSRETLRFLLSNFGSEHGRWIVRLPNEWKKQVNAALSSSPLREVDRTRVVEWLKLDKGRFFGSGGDTFDPNAPWLPNALRHHASRPFAKILAVSNPDSHTDVVIPENEDDLTACLPSPHIVSVERSAPAIVSAAAPLLSKGNELLFIDPHFGPEARFLDVLQAALQAVAQRTQKPQRIEYHFNARISAAEFRQNWERAISRAIPAGLAVSFVAWTERIGGEQLHDRFILAPIGGVDVTVGLDTGTAGQTTRITRLTATTHTKIWADYQHGKPTAAFDLAWIEQIIR